eukprot:183589-Alexandrium_andersonii.AAC.1
MSIGVHQFVAVHRHAREELNTAVKPLETARSCFKQFQAAHHAVSGSLRGIALAPWRRPRSVGCSALAAPWPLAVAPNPHRSEHLAGHFGVWSK